jgi:hypothetical protein
VASVRVSSTGGPGGRRCAPGDPLHRPLGLAGDAGDVLDGVKEVLLLGCVLDVRLQQQAVHLCGQRGCVSAAESVRRLEQGEPGWVHSCRHSAAVRTGVDVLDGDLETVEGTRLHKHGEVSEV